MADWSGTSNTAYPVAAGGMRFERRLAGCAHCSGRSASSRTSGRGPPGRRGFRRLFRLGSGFAGRDRDQGLGVPAGRWGVLLVDLGWTKAMRFTNGRQSRLVRYPGMYVRIVYGFDVSGPPGRDNAMSGISPAGARLLLPWPAGEPCLSSRPTSAPKYFALMGGVQIVGSASGDLAWLAGRCPRCGGDLEAAGTRFARASRSGYRPSPVGKLPCREACHGTRCGCHARLGTPRPVHLPLPAFAAACCLLSGQAISPPTTRRAGPLVHKPVDDLCKRAANLCARWGLRWGFPVGRACGRAVTWENIIYALCTGEELKMSTCHAAMAHK